MIYTNLEFIRLLFFGWLFNTIISIIIHLLALFTSVDKDCQKIIIKPNAYLKKKKEEKKFLKTIISLVLSYDYFIADLLKKSYDTGQNSEKIKKEYLTKYIQKTNHYNFVTSLVISCLVLLNICSDVSQVLLFLAIRAISRSLEIGYAFYKDIFQGDKKSNLVSDDRIKLAVKSYFEIIVNFATVYYFLDLFNTIINYSVFMNRDVLFEALFFSVGVSTFVGVEFDFGNICCKYCGTLTSNCYFLEKNILIAIQLFSSMCLVYFALAKYIGDQSNKNDSESAKKNEVNNNSRLDRKGFDSNSMCNKSAELIDHRKYLPKQCKINGTSKTKKQ